MKHRRVDPGVQALLQEANRLPDCSARLAVQQRAASRAESLGDLDTAWDTRCQILRARSTMTATHFAPLFLNMAWCLAMAEKDPARFNIDGVLWSYKWVANAAPRYASIPRSVMERLVDDLEARYIKHGWGRRGAVWMRIETLYQLGEFDQVRALITEWKALPRDRGADCPACEASGLAEILNDLGQPDDAVQTARAVIAGKMSCATVPHSTFGFLPLILLRMGREAQARELHERGRRLVAKMDENSATLAIGYAPFAAAKEDPAQAQAIIRSHLRAALSLPSEYKKLHWFGPAAIAAESLARRGVEDLDLPATPGLSDEGHTPTTRAAHHFRTIAEESAAALDRRNGNDFHSRRLQTLTQQWAEISK